MIFHEPVNIQSNQRNKPLDNPSNDFHGDYLRNKILIHFIKLFLLRSDSHEQFLIRRLIVWLGSHLSEMRKIASVQFILPIKIIQCLCWMKRQILIPNLKKTVNVRDYFLTLCHIKGLFNLLGSESILNITFSTRKVTAIKCTVRISVFYESYQYV